MHNTIPPKRFNPKKLVSIHHILNALGEKSDLSASKRGEWLQKLLI